MGKQKEFYIIVLGSVDERSAGIMECTTHLRYKSDRQRCCIYIRV